MTKGCKNWLWFMFVVNILTVIPGVATIPTNTLTGIYSVIASIAMITGVALLLFRQRKNGLYLIIVIAVIDVIVAAVNGVNIIFALISAAIFPAVTYYFVSKNNNIFK